MSLCVKNKIKTLTVLIPCIVAVIIKVGRVLIISICLSYVLFWETRRRLVGFET